MRAKWTEYALAQRKEISSYIQRKFGARRKERFLHDVREATTMVKKFPNIGTIDPLFADRNGTYRSIIIGGLSKMVYRIEGDNILIVAMWDCRQEPQGQAKNIK
jgi:plasmid stabilization system protein ParE